MRAINVVRAGAMLAVLSLVACENEQVKREPGETVTGAAPTTSVGAIKETPDRYYGKTVRLSGEVDEIYNDKAFDLEGAGWAIGDNITVMTKSPVTISGVPLAKGDEIVLVGKVRPFVEAELERDLGWDLSTELNVKLSKRPVIVAESIRKVMDYGRWPALPKTEPIRDVLIIVTTVDLTTLAGHKVELERAYVQSVEGKGLWVGPNRMSQVFVLPEKKVLDVKPGDRAKVTGTLQKAPKDATKEWDLPSSMEGAVHEDMLFINDARVEKVK